MVEIARQSIDYADLQNERFWVGAWEVDAAAGTVSCDGVTKRIRAKVMDLLVCFAERPGEVLTKDALLNAVWRTEVISESALTKTITELRQALNDTADRSAIIENIPKRGYRLVAPVTKTGPARTADVAIAMTAATPWRRGRVLAWMTGALFAVAGLVFVVQTRDEPSAAVPWEARQWILIGSFANNTGDEQLDGTIGAALDYALRDSAHVNVVPGERVRDVLRLMRLADDTIIDANAARAIALRDGQVRFVVDGVIDRRKEGYVVTARLVNPESGAAVATLTATSLEAGPAVEELARRVRSLLGDPTTAVGSSKTSPGWLRASPLYADGLTAAASNEWEKAEALFQAAFSWDADFAPARTWVGWCRLRRGDPQGAIAHAQAAVALLGGDTSERDRAFVAGSYDLIAGDTGGALKHFDALVARYPDDAWAIRTLARANDTMGRRRTHVRDLLIRLTTILPHDFEALATAAQTVSEFDGAEAAGPYVKRAVALMNETAIEPGPNGIRTWVQLFAAHDLWLQRRPAEAVAVIDRVETGLAAEPDGIWGRVFVGSLRLSVGQLALAHKAFSSIPERPRREMFLAFAALARGDKEAVAKHITAYSGADLAAVSLLVAAGQTTAAERLLERLAPGVPEPNPTWAALEIRAARGERVQREALRDMGAPWLPAMGGVRSFLYTERFAEALSNGGDTRAALALLDETMTLRERLYTRSSHNGHLWMRLEQLRADLHRRAGRVTDAAVIESNLLKALAIADSDHPQRLAVGKLHTVVPRKP